MTITTITTVRPLARTGDAFMRPRVAYGVQFDGGPAAEPPM